jgi:hypothetical protein
VFVPAHEKDVGGHPAVVLSLPDILEDDKQLRLNIKEMAGIKSADVIVPVRRAHVKTELRLRVVTTPQSAAAQLLAHLGLRLPQGLRLINNVVPKIGV